MSEKMLWSYGLTPYRRVALAHWNGSAGGPAWLVLRVRRYSRNWKPFSSRKESSTPF